MKQTIKWGIIGCGDVTEIKSGPAYKMAEGFELVAVMRRNLKLAKDYAERHNVPRFYNDADELINHPEVDAVYIATPPDTHRYYALKVANAGKICCIEKPMAPSYAECLDIQTTFERQNLPLFVAYYRRSLPRFNKVKSLLEEKAIGDVRHVSWYLSRTPSTLDTSDTYNWRTDGKIAPAGYFDDLASHGIDLFAYLFGNITCAKGVSGNQQNLYTAKDIISGSWEHESGVVGTGMWSFGTYKREDKVRIIGSEGELSFSVFGEVPIEIITKNKTEQITIENPKHIQKFHVANMAKHLSSDFQHPSTGATATHTAWVMDKILG
ncbi:Gfo/Idh/MocA family protein [Winogradskyella alexanderae]|uniref:Gfo/Idh/MocA family oxidoreductase n=1 Tax=Winogradskyella alexanderae TaxID=2877123 RepID=A0ABS7XN65_9FLAO|nr:Gfo/Idh/MocA family oxidoreductase [Winogradskyella alexanderae]MCA0131447.1 Gfo/Idh/MocA family oxidoreductase [Winogradskyella alexanderae]